MDSSRCRPLVEGRSVYVSATACTEQILISPYQRIVTAEKGSPVSSRVIILSSPSRYLSFIAGPCTVGHVFFGGIFSIREMRRITVIPGRDPDEGQLVPIRSAA